MYQVVYIEQLQGDVILLQMNGQDRIIFVTTEPDLIVKLYNSLNKYGWQRNIEREYHQEDDIGGWFYILNAQRNSSIDLEFSVKILPRG